MSQGPGEEFLCFLAELFPTLVAGDNASLLRMMILSYRDCSGKNSAYKGEGTGWKVFI